MSQMPQQPQVVIHKVQSNGLGTASFILSLVGLLCTLGFLSPLAVLFGFIAMFKAPRGMAVAGFILGLIGSAILIFFGFFFLIAFLASAGMAGSFPWTTDWAEKAIVAHYDQTGALPSEADGNELANALGHRYVLKDATSFDLYLPGPDGKLNTADDELARSWSATAAPATTPAPAPTP